MKWQQFPQKAEGPLMVTGIRCLLLVLLCGSMSHARSIPVLDLDFGSAASPLQPGFATASTGTVVFSYESIEEGLPIQRFYFEGDNTGTFGPLISDGLWFPDDFLASQSGVAFGVYYTISGLDPASDYEVTVYTPPEEGLNEFSVRGALEGVFVSSDSFLRSQTYALQPDASGEISGSVSSATGPSAWSGISVRLQVPEPASASVLAIALATVASSMRRR